MPRRDFQSVDEYIASQPEEARAVLERVRTIIRKALPTAEETISYRIPAYKLPAGAVLYFAGWKRHYAIYPAGTRLIEALRQDLAPCEVRGSTIRFPLSRPVPARLIGRIARFRAEEVRIRG